MKQQSFQITPHIRKLGVRDIDNIYLHFLRLDDASRYSRFGTVVKDRFIQRYARDAVCADAIVFGAFIDGDICAIGELRGLCYPPSKGAEIALSVEAAWQGKGIGGALFSRLVTASQNRGMRSVHVLFLSGNKKMQNIAAKYSPKFWSDGGQTEAQFEPSCATLFSMASETFVDFKAYIHGYCGTTLLRGRNQAV
jgi:GNAT superfamily N-acetyltransferase